MSIVDDLPERIAPARALHERVVAYEHAVLPPARSAGEAADRLREAAGAEFPDDYVFRRRVLGPAAKWAVVLALSSAWMALSIWLSQRWVADLSTHVPAWFATFCIAFIAWVPGFMNAFLIGSIALDRRPVRKKIDVYPDVCVLVACYNEQDNIRDTIDSIARQRYPAHVDVVIVDDGSTDASVAIASAAAAEFSRSGLGFRVLRMPRNGGKAAALNAALDATTADLVATIDADSWVYADALLHLVERFLSDPPDTVAVAGAVLVRNSRANAMARAQEWDYFHGIAAVKRMQSMYNGTLVAQGAFSLYTRRVLEEVGGWPECVGEDIVVTWAMLERGYRIGYCEEACLFTNVPLAMKQFVRQRQRWSRGMMEAFARHWRLLLRPRLTTLFIWWNLLFVPLDLVYTFVFMPGVVAALFGVYWVAGPLTLLVLPLAALWNVLIFKVQSDMFKRKELRVRRNWSGFFVYVLAYSMVLQPACVAGYASELLRMRKTWGTK